MGTSKKDKSDRERDKEERASSKKRRRDSGEGDRESSSKLKIMMLHPHAPNTHLAIFNVTAFVVCSFCTIPPTTASLKVSTLSAQEGTIYLMFP